jgi:hypothetical protein
MILGIERTRPRQIGGRYTGDWIDDVLYPDQPFVVLRQATYQEWLEEGNTLPRCDPSEALFYECSLD